MATVTDVRVDSRYSDSPRVIDPIVFIAWNWPDIRLYDKQKEILYSVRDNNETFCPAGNQLGKDFVAGLAALWWFVSRRPSRVVTTSVNQEQLDDVLWGEVRRFIQESKYELPIQYNHRKIRQLHDDGKFDPNSELVARVSNTQEGLLGRHSTAGFKPIQNDVPRTLVIFDEASGIDDGTFQSTQTWAQRKLVIGNPFPCTNFFYRGVKEGDIPRPDGKGYYRKVIKIKAEDSPNVRLAQEQIKRGIEPTGKILVPGVKSWEKYQEHRIVWDAQLQCIGLDAEFYEGADVKLYPVEWLNRATTAAATLPAFRKGKAMGVDTAQGGDSTVWTIVDDLGVIKAVSKKTPDTSIIPNETIALIRQYDIPPEKVNFDAGGGGKEHVDRLRRMGYNVRAVAFGEGATPDKRRGLTTLEQRKKQDEHRYVYKNRRAEMYGEAGNILNPALRETPFGIPAEYKELFRQLSLIPRWYDEEGRMFLPPKQHRPDVRDKAKKQTMHDICGCSPDEADSFVLAVFALISKPVRRVAGAMR